MSSNYKDIYYRHNPRKTVKCNPLYVDNYKPFLETFENRKKKNYNLLQNTDFKISGGNYEDKFSYINNPEEDKINLICKDNKYILESKGVDKMYDLNLESLMKRKNKGEIINVDLLHNNNIIKSMNYDKSHISAIDKVSNRLLRTLNDKVTKSNNFSTLEDPFFSHPAHNNYKWNNSYFKKSGDKNIEGKWWDVKQAKAKPLDYKTIIDYRTKRPAKVNYDTIQYINKK